MPKKKSVDQQPYFSHTIAQPPPAEPWADRVAAYKRYKPQIEQFARRQFWTREKFVEHWTEMLNNQRSSGIQLQFAADALAYLRADASSIKSEREPGADDE